MAPYYYQARKKKRKIQQGISLLLLFVSALIVLVCFLFPSITGRFGEAIHLALMKFSGLPAILIPCYLFWLAWRLTGKERRTGTGIKSFFAFLVFSSITSLFSIFHTASHRVAGGAGGWLGDQLSIFLIDQFGVFFASLLILSIIFFSGALFLDISPLRLLASLKEKIVQDLSDWRSERKKMQERARLAKKLDAPQAWDAPRAWDGIVLSKKELPPERSAPPLLPDSAEPELLEERVSNTRGVSHTHGVSHIPNSSAREGFPEKSAIEEPKKKKDKAFSPDFSDPAGTAVRASGRDLTALDPYAQYLLPELNLLEIPDANHKLLNREELYANGTLLEQTLEQFHVKARVIDIHPGPVITRYDLSPAPGVRVQAIETLVHDIALAMKAQSLRVIAPIPGKAAVGIEISNPHPATVYLGELLATSQFLECSEPLALAIGKNTEGVPFVTDLVSMPHLLIAGATGSGKSVCIHSLILSILFRHKPDSVKLLLIDPKRLELPVYNGLPHLYNPACDPEEVSVLTEPKEVIENLKELILVMEERYKEFAKAGARNIESYNEKKKREHLAPTPYIVVIIDELADLMVTVGREIEDSIQRLAQMARAVGIHLVLATQRPSVDVITGVIKANLPSRIAFQVLSKTDSRVILDTQGAEDLLGRGDMLFLVTGATRPVRLQGAFVTESDVNRVLKFIKEQNFSPAYEVLPEESEEESIVESEENRRLLLRAAKVVRDTEKVSGDLLRADKEIGSRYDLALTLLRKKGIIEKPKDTNRWKIHFDRLAEFLAEAEKNEKG